MPGDIEPWSRSIGGLPGGLLGRDDDPEVGDDVPDGEMGGGGDFPVAIARAFCL